MTKWGGENRQTDRQKQKDRKRQRMECHIIYLFMLLMYCYIFSQMREKEDKWKMKKDLRSKYLWEPDQNTHKKLKRFFFLLILNAKHFANILRRLFFKLQYFRQIDSNI